MNALELKIRDYWTEVKKAMPNEKTIFLDCLIRWKSEYGGGYNRDIISIGKAPKENSPADLATVFHFNTFEEFMECVATAIDFSSDNFDTQEDYEAELEKYNTDEPYDGDDSEVTEREYYFEQSPEDFCILDVVGIHL